MKELKMRGLICYMLFSACLIPSISFCNGVAMVSAVVNSDQINGMSEGQPIDIYEGLLLNAGDSLTTIKNAGLKVIHLYANEEITIPDDSTITIQEKTIEGLESREIKAIAKLPVDIALSERDRQTTGAALNDKASPSDADLPEGGGVEESVYDSHSEDTFEPSTIELENIVRKEEKSKSIKNLPGGTSIGQARQRSAEFFEIALPESMPNFGSAQSIANFEDWKLYNIYLTVKDSLKIDEQISAVNFVVEGSRRIYLLKSNDTEGPTPKFAFICEKAGCYEQAAATWLKFYAMHNSDKYKETVKTHLDRIKGLMENH